MICKKCGTEIADKAIVCFRCGTPTAGPNPSPARPARATSRIPAAIALIVLTIAALYMGQAAAGEAPRLLSWGVAALAVVVLAWRLIQRR